MISIIPRHTFKKNTQDIITETKKKLLKNRKTKIKKQISINDFKPVISTDSNKNIYKMSDEVESDKYEKEYQEALQRLKLK